MIERRQRRWVTQGNTIDDKESQYQKLNIEEEEKEEKATAK